MEQVKIRFKDGKVKVDAVGFTGERCVNELQWLEELLGTPDSRDYKEEFYVLDEVIVR